MRLFPRYDKEGPGVYADDPKAGAFVRFFQTYARKFGKMIILNLMFLLFNIPSLILAYVGAVIYLPMLNPIFVPDAFEKYLTSIGVVAADAAVSSTEVAMQLYFMILLVIIMWIVGMLLVTIGPFQTGFSYVYRNFAREIPVFLWGDFVSAVKSNFKQSLKAMFVTLLITSIILVNIVFYARIFTQSFSQILLTIFIMIFLFFMCIQIFVYPMIASVELKLRDIYKNSVLFFLGRFLPTLGIFIVNLIVLLVIPVILMFTLTYIGLAISILYYALFAFSFTQYLNSFFVWQQIERYIVNAPDRQGKDEKQEG